MTENDNVIDFAPQQEEGEEPRISEDLELRRQLQFAQTMNAQLGLALLQFAGRDEAMAVMDAANASVEIEISPVTRFGKVMVHVRRVIEPEAVVGAVEAHAQEISR